MATQPNPDLAVASDNKALWSQANRRRRGMHNLQRIARYGSSFRSRQVMTLEKRVDTRIAMLEEVQRLTSLPSFSAMVVVRGSLVLYERYAPDFAPDQPHSIQSITKTLVHLIIGRLVEHGVLDLSRPVADYLPQIGSGYATASVQRLLNMDVVNDYSEDFTDPKAAYYRHEEAMGWRLPLDPAKEATQKTFLPQIRGQSETNSSGGIHYKDANTAVLGWIAEEDSGRSLRSFLAEIVDAAGIENSWYITTDREGFPTLEGGACLSARDLARYLSIFIRGGHGVGHEVVGSAAFLERSLSSGVPMPSHYPGLLYSNHLMVKGRCLGHGGWAGQYAMANLDTKTIGVFFSVMEDEHGATRSYMPPLVHMLETVTGPAFA